MFNNQIRRNHTMDLANECIYEILTFLGPKELLLCYQLNNNFNNLSKLESLWKLFVDKKYKKSFGTQTYYGTCRMYYPLYHLLVIREKQDIEFNTQRHGYFDGSEYLEHIGKNSPNYVEFSIMFKNKYDIDLYRNILRTLKNIKKYDQIRIRNNYPFSTPQIVKVRGPHKDEFVNQVSDVIKKNLEIEKEYNYLVGRLNKLGCCYIEKPIYEQYSDNWYECIERYDLNTSTINVLCHRYTHLYSFLKQYIYSNVLNNI